MQELIDKVTTGRDMLSDDPSPAAFFEAARVKLVHVKLFLEMVQDKETAPSAEWVANRAKELLA